MPSSKKKRSQSRSQVNKNKGASKKISKAKTTRFSKATSKSNLRIVKPDIRNKSILAQLKTMKVLTPYLVSSHFNLNLGVAKNFLEDLRRQGKVVLVSHSRNVRIYKPSE